MAADAGWRKRAAAAATAAVVVVALTAAVLAGCADDNDTSCEKPLAGQRWSEIPYENEERIQAAQRLVRCRTLVGATKREVRALLGPPDQSSRREWAYGLGGRESALGPGDMVDLTISFRRDGRVRSAFVP